MALIKNSHKINLDYFNWDIEWPDLKKDNEEFKSTYMEPPKKKTTPIRVLNTGRVLEDVPVKHWFVLFEDYKVDMGFAEQSDYFPYTWVHIHVKAKEQYPDYPYDTDNSMYHLGNKVVAKAMYV